MRKILSIGLCGIGVLILIVGAGVALSGYANWKMNGGGPSNVDLIVEGLVAAALAVAFAGVLLVLGRWAYKTMFARLLGIVLAIEGAAVLVIDRVREWTSGDTAQNAAYVLAELDLQVYTLAVGAVALVLGILLFALATRRRTDVVDAEPSCAGPAFPR